MKSKLEMNFYLNCSNLYPAHYHQSVLRCRTVPIYLQLNDKKRLNRFNTMRSAISGNRIHLKWLKSIFMEYVIERVRKSNKERIKPGYKLGKQ